MIQALFWLLCTIIVYMAAKRIYRAFPRVYLTPLLVTPLVVITIIIMSGVTFDTYNKGAVVLSDLVEPATIALAVMLYKHIDVLKRNVKAILLSVCCGAVISFLSTAELAHLFGLKSDVLASLAPRTATTPIAVSISGMIGGVPTITAGATLITGLIGMIVGPLIVKWCSIHSPIGQGTLFGTSAHSAGISKAFEYDAVAGSIASIAMMLTAFVTLLIVPWLIALFQ
ncbi:CidB/LrgB family autolysis modulator [Paenibacillus sp. HJL G12]|uniref:CidB/LrgB family autolysis modulator n=1 Tax=Paenibacillus dendrobii TaxID=2691084 RepID=A0A7X3ILS7_9BACL|nr:LrgB family protein [Paenibacillus dendrobii]MWV46308.1 CidB/LrgB family autolysis modulator [Paenibacillus dendrobii]